MGELWQVWPLRRRILAIASKAAFGLYEQACPV